MLDKREIEALNSFLEENNLYLEEIEEYIQSKNIEAAHQALQEEEEIAKKRCMKLLGKCFKFSSANGDNTYYRVLAACDSYESVYCTTVPDFEIDYPYSDEPELRYSLDIIPIDINFFMRAEEVSVEEFKEAGAKFMREFVETDKV